MKERILKEIETRLLLIKTGRSRSSNDESLRVTCERYKEELSRFSSDDRVRQWLRDNYYTMLVVVCPSHKPKFVIDCHRFMKG